MWGILLHEAWMGGAIMTEVKKCSQAGWLFPNHFWHVRKVKGVLMQKCFLCHEDVRVHPPKQSYHDTLKEMTSDQLHAEALRMAQDLIAGRMVA